MSKKAAEQLQLDTRSEMAMQVDNEASVAIDSVTELIKAYGYRKAPVRNRHEAYGVAAEHYSAIAGTTKMIKHDLEDLLGTLSQPSLNAVEAISAIGNSVRKAVIVTLYAAAEMRLTLEGLFDAENHDSEYSGDSTQPGLDSFLEAGSFEENTESNTEED